MTLATTVSKIIYDGLIGQDTFSYTFRVDFKSDMNVLLGADALPEGDWTITGLGNAGGGDVTLNTPLVANETVTLLRVVPLTQQVDYQPFDAFPAETHEQALDKLTMQTQQIDERVDGSLRFPVSDTANPVYPAISERAEKYSFFDIEGNVTVVNVDPTAPSVQRISITDDSLDLMRVTTSQGGADPTNPHLGFNKINAPLGSVQLTAQGEIPIELLNIIGIQVRGPFRGDDLCPKPNDNGGCTFPDTRNPTQRLPTINFSTGDAFIITIIDGETEGTMELFIDAGDAVPSIVTVQSSDTIIFIDTDDVLAGWYHFPQLLELGNATDISYTEGGNTYVLGPNVQVALDNVDSHLLETDDWYLSNRTQLRAGFLVTSLDLLLASGFYVTLAGATGAPTAGDAFSVIHNTRDTDNMTQIAISHTNGQSYSRAFIASTWTDWNDGFSNFLAGYLSNGHNGPRPTGDLDLLITNQKQTILSSEVSNLPDDLVGSWFTLEVMAYQNSDGATQRLTGLENANSHMVWLRNLWTGSWTDWKLVVDGGAFTLRLEGYRDDGRHSTFTGDLDTLITNATHRIFDTDVTNDPDDFTLAGFITVQVNDNLSNMIQTIVRAESQTNKIWQRVFSSSSWAAWKLVVDGGAMTLRLAGYEDTGLHEQAPDAGFSDLDTILLNSVYNVLATAVTNKPDDFTAGNGTLYTNMTSTNTNAGQYLFGANQNDHKIWARSRIGSVWGAWKLVVDGNTVSMPIVGDFRVVGTPNVQLSVQPSAGGGLPRIRIRDSAGTTRFDMLFNDVNGQVLLQRKTDASVTETELKFEDDGNVSVDGVAPTQAANLTRKDYVDGLGADVLVGAVIMWPVTATPSGFLQCDGSSVSRTTFAALFSVLGIIYGNVDGNTFNLPDYRGTFMRGSDNGSGNDPDASGRTDRGDGVGGDVVGSKQGGEISSHTHASAGAHTHPMELWDAGSTASRIQGGGFNSGSPSGTGTTESAGAHTHPSTGGSETRPVNVGINFIIRTSV